MASARMLLWVSLTTLAAAACGDDPAPGGGGDSDTTRPSVTSIAPADGALSVARNTPVVVVLSEAIDTATLGGALTLARGEDAVDFTHSYDSATFTVTVTPSAQLAAFSDYRFTVGTELADVAGNRLAAPATVLFTTVDDIAPSKPAAPTDGGQYSTSGEVTFSWTAATDNESGVASYVLEVATANDGTGVLSSQNVGNVLTGEFTGSSGQTLYARVAAVDAAGNQGALSDFSNGITIDTSAPPAPAAPVDAGAFEDTDVVFDWVATSDGETAVASYWLQVATATDGTGALVDEDVGSTFSYHATASDGETLYARVAATNAAGLRGNFSPWSDGVLVDVTPPTAPGVPADAGDWDDAVVAVSWSAASDGAAGSGIEGYALEVSVDGGSTVADTVLFGDATATAFGGAAYEGDTLVFQVVAFDAAGNESSPSGWSDGITVDATAPTTPGNVTDRGDVSRSSTLEFSWLAASDSGSGVTSYIITIATADDGTGIVSTSPASDGLSHIFFGDDGVTYYASVVAVDAADNTSASSGWSDGIRVDTTAPGQPTTPTDEGEFTSSATTRFEWTAGPGAFDHYVIEIGTSPDADDALSATAVYATGYDFAVPSTPNGVTYYARVAAVASGSPDLQGAWSNPSDGITFDNTAPTAPGTPVDAGDLSPRQVQFNWPAASDGQSGIDHYEVLISTVPNAAGAVAPPQDATGTSYVYDASGMDYAGLYASVRAVNGAGITGDWSAWSDGIEVDGQPPSVLWAWPNDGFVGASPAVDMTIFFSEPMDPAKVEAALALHDLSDDGAEPQHGYAFFWDNSHQQVTVMPDTQEPAGINNIDLLAPGHSYLLTVTSAATDLAGNPLSTWDGAWTPSDLEAAFEVAETTPPQLLAAVAGSTSLLSAPVAVGDVEDGDAIVLTFDEPMMTSEASVSISCMNGRWIDGRIEQGWVHNASGDGDYVTYILDREHQLYPGAPVSVSGADPASFNFEGVVLDLPDGHSFRVVSAVTDSYSCCATASYAVSHGLSVAWTAATQLRVTLDPGAALAAGDCELRLESVADAVGNRTWASVPLQVMDPGVADAVGPTFLSSLPADQATGVARTSPILLSFSESVRASTLSSVTITGLTAEDFTVMYPMRELGGMAAIIPHAPWPAGAALTVTLPAGVTDLAGNALANPTSIAFNVISPVDTAAPEVAESLPVNGSTFTDRWDVELLFADSVTGAWEQLDPTSVDAADVLVVDLTTGMPRRGWSWRVESLDTTARLQPPPRMNGFETYRPTISVLSASVGAGQVTFTTAAEHGVPVGAFIDVQMFEGPSFYHAQVVSVPAADQVVIDAGAGGPITGEGVMSWNAPRTYEVILSDAALTGGDGLTDLAGNAMVGESLVFTVAEAPANRWPVPSGLQELRFDLSTAPSARVLSGGFEVRDADHEVVDVTITSQDIPGLLITGTVDTSMNSWFEAGGSDGPPTQSSPGVLDPIVIDTTGPVALEITLDDGTAQTTFVRTAWMWATADLPSIDSVGGVDVDASQPVLITDSTPTFEWSNVDVANADVLQLVLADITALSGGGEGGDSGPMFFQILAPSVQSATLPDAQALPIGLYLWTVQQMKMPPTGFGDALGTGWALDLAGSPPPMDAFFVFGPSNPQLSGMAFGHASIGLEVDGNGDLRGLWDNYGTLTLDGAVSAAVTMTEHDGSGPTTIPEFYAYDGATRELMMAAMMDGPPRPTRGTMGRSETLALLTQGMGAIYDEGSGEAYTAPLVAAAARRFATSGFNTNSLDGELAFVNFSVWRDPSSGAFDGFEAGVGTAVAMAGVLDSFDAVSNAGVPYGPGGPVPYSIDGDGLVTIAMSASDSGYGYIGGAAGDEVVPMAAVTDGDFTWWLLMGRAQSWAGDETEANVAGDYTFINVGMRFDSGLGRFVETYSGWGTANLSGLTSADNLSYQVYSPGFAMSGTETYTVDAADERIYFGSMTLVALGPQFDTLMGIGVSDADFVEILILTR